MKRLLTVLAVAAAGAAGLYVTGHLPLPGQLFKSESKAEPAAVREPVAPAVTVVRAAPADFRQTILLTGTLVPREEVLITPEIEGQRLVDVTADEGQRVEKGQVLARLETATLDAQLAQNDANLARSNAAIAQAESQILQAEARVEEARNAYSRAEPLRKQGYLSESTYDQREATAKTADAALVAARDGLKVARADKELAEAQRRELLWKRSRTDIKAPTDGIISRRNARIGGLASSVGDPLFRIIAAGEVELDAEVPEIQLARLQTGQPASISVAGLGDVRGRVRLVSPEIDRASRLGRVRILLEDLDRPRVGSFARGTVLVAEGRGIAVPLSSVQYQGDGARVQVVVDNRIVTRPVKTGLAAGDRVEITQGIADGDLVVARAGTFLRDGDRVRPVDEKAQLSEAK